MFLLHSWNQWAYQGVFHYQYKKACASVQTYQVSPCDVYADIPLAKAVHIAIRGEVRSSPGERGRGSDYLLSIIKSATSPVMSLASHSCSVAGVFGSRTLWLYFPARMREGWLSGCIVQWEGPETDFQRTPHF